MSYDNDLRFSLWRVRDKESPSHNDFNGTVTVSAPGVYFLNGWIRPADANPKAPSISGNLKFKEALPVPKIEDPRDEPYGKGVTTKPDFEDDIPF